MKKTWGLINELLGNVKSKQKSVSMNVNGSLCNDSNVIANEFNSFFNNIPKKA